MKVIRGSTHRGTCESLVTEPVTRSSDAYRPLFDSRKEGLARRADCQAAENAGYFRMAQFRLPNLAETQETT